LSCFSSKSHVILQMENEDVVLRENSFRVQIYLLLHNKYT